jgi:hypothetical protein
LCYLGCLKLAAHLIDSTDDEKDYKGNDEKVDDGINENTIIN